MLFINMYIKKLLHRVTAGYDSEAERILLIKLNPAGIKQLFFLSFI